MATAANSVENTCCCQVCNVLSKGFSTYSFAGKKELIDQGKAKPPLHNLTKKVTTYTRHFNVELYENVEWLTGCETKSKLFCWPCVLFSTDKSVWNKAGFSDLNNLHKVIKRHSSCKNHLECVFKWKTFGKSQRIDHALDSQLKIDHQKHNELVKKNRDILKRFIDVVCFLGIHELGFRGHSETSDSVNKGNYKDLVLLISKYDPILAHHLETSTVFQGTSNYIQNDLISSVSTVTLNYIKKEILDCPFIAISLDETTDVTNTSQLSVVVRYPTKDGNVQERFLGFLDVSSDRTAEALYKIVCKIVDELKCGSKLVAQSYDGAAVMSGHLTGLQTRVKQSFPCALFVHCFAHRLNLVLSQSAGAIKECKIFFMSLSGLASFFSQSSKRTHALDEIVKKRLPKVSPTRWNYNGRLVQTVLEYRQPLIELFDSILESADNWDSETLNSSRGYSTLLKTDFSFNFLLHVFGEIFPLTDILFDVLQSKTNDIVYCVQKVSEFKTVIQNKRDEFLKIWNLVKNLSDVSQPQSKRIRVDNVGDMEMCYRKLFFQVIDNILEQLHSRFSNVENLKFLELTNLKKYYNASFPQSAFDSLISNYGCFFDAVALRSQLSVLLNTKQTINVSDANSVSEVLKFLKENELEAGFSEVVKFCELTLTIPATTSSVERSFSVLKRIKTFVRNSTGQDRMSQLAVMSIEKLFIKELSQQQQFYDDVIDDFAKQNRRIVLQFI